MQKLDLVEGPLTYRGAAEIRPLDDRGVTFSRLPRRYGHLMVPMMRHVARTTSGVRVAFATDSTNVTVRAIPTVVGMAGPDAPAGRSAVDLAVDGQLVDSQSSGGGIHIRADPRQPEQAEVEDRGEAVYDFELDGEMTDIELWLPHNANTLLTAIEIDDDASAVAAAPDPRPRWIHYGSSISQCSEAHSPLRTWPALVARLGGHDLTNLGFAGQCHLDPFVARYVRDQPADRISLKVGINITGSASLTQRTFGPALHGFLDTVRDGHPTTPIVVASPIWCPFLETDPGPSRYDPIGVFIGEGDPASLAEGALTLTWIRDYIERAVVGRIERGDPHLTYVDGLELFSAADTADLPDRLHPNGDGYERIGERWHALVG